MKKIQKHFNSSLYWRYRITLVLMLCLFIVTFASSATLAQQLTPDTSTQQLSQSTTITQSDPTNLVAMLALPQILPCTPTLVSPLITSFDSPANVTFTWVHCNETTWYEVYVSSTSGYLSDLWYEVGSTITCGANCTKTINALPAGSYSWWIRGWNLSGYGQWSNAGTFTVTAPPLPCIPTLVSPLVTSFDSPANVTFTWSHCNQTAWYELYVSNTSGYVSDVWYQVGSNITCGANCTKTINALPAGTYSWWVRGWNEAGYGAWTSAGTFTVNAPPLPCIPTQIDPLGDIYDSPANVTFTWSHCNQTTWYELYVSSTAGYVSDVWYQVGSTVTCGANCSKTINALPAGTYSWWVRGWNDAGYGSWTSAGTFTVTAPPLPCTPTQIDPLGDVYDTPANVTFIWSHCNQTVWYELYVSSTAGYVSDVWYQVGSTVTCGANCSKTINALPAGTYSWWVRGWNEAGYGQWTSAGTFTVNPPPLPCMPSVISPFGDFFNGPASVTFTWDHCGPEVTWYHLYVSSNWYLYDHWYEVGNGVTCTTTCSVTVSGLPDGFYSWWVQGWNSAGTGPWSDETFFVMDGGVYSIRFNNSTPCYITVNIAGQSLPLPVNGTVTIQLQPGTYSYTANSSGCGSLTSSATLPPNIERTFILR